MGRLRWPYIKPACHYPSGRGGTTCCGRPICAALAAVWWIDVTCRACMWALLRLPYRGRYG